jgi:hypothetical protein
MAKKRKKIPPDMKLNLVKEAGMKCANPGCSNYRTHIHHIQEWHVYRTHNKDHMIAICPSCHDAVHHGKLSIEDATVYRWKEIKRTELNRDIIYIEPSKPTKILLGSIAATGDSGLIVFELSAHNRLSFRLVDEDIFFLNLVVTNRSGLEVIKIVDNHVKYLNDENLQYERRPGRLCLSIPISEEFIPDWALTRIRREDSKYAINGQLILLDVEVLEPGLARVQGIWTEGEKAIIITKEFISFDNLKNPHPLIIEGEGVNSVLVYQGSINSSLFSLG